MYQVYKTEAQRKKWKEDYMKEKGLYYPHGEFKTDKQIKRELALKGELPIFESNVKYPRDVYYYLDRAKMIGDLMKESSPRADKEIKIHFSKTSILNISGDWHYGHPNTDTDRIKQELEVIENTPDSYLVLTGDLLHGIHWGGAGGAEQSATLDEQRLFLASLFTKLVEMTVGEQEYKMVNQHKARGHSMYNKNHPTFRQSRFGLQGADIYTSNHNHRKQVSQEAVRVFGGARIITHVASGAYISGDEYGERQGFPKLKPKEMYGVAIRVHADRDLVEVEYDILEAHRKWA